MIDANDFIEKIVLQHGEYDPQKAHDYYMRTRKLKGRKEASTQPSKGLPATQAGYPGKPHKLGTRFEEDESPMASPTGAKLTSYTGTGLGKAVYADGHVYDGKLGWIKPQGGSQRVNSAQAKLDRVRKAVEKAPPAKRAALTKQIAVAQQKLNAIKASTKSRANQ